MDAISQINKKVENPYQAIDLLLKQLRDQTEKVAPGADIFQKLTLEIANVVRYSLSQWQTAYEDAIDPLRYDREDLLDLYEQMEIDEHITALGDTIFNNMISNGFLITGPDGTEDVDATALFARPWFSQYVAMALDTIFHGFNGIQFTGIANGAYSGTKLIPRRHILPLLAGIRYQDNNDSPDILFADKSIFPWTVFMFPQLPLDQYKLGKFNKCAKLFILKRENIQFWAMFNEIFGIPFRVMKTNLADSTRMGNAITAMKTMTAAAWSVIHEDDEVTFHNGVAAANSSTFKDFLEWCNKGMSKAIVGSTMVLEDGSSRSQGEVHERNTNAFIVSYQRIIAEWINEQVIPKMVGLGMAITENHRFKWDDSEILSKTQLVELLGKLKSAGFKVDIDYVIEHIGIPVEVAEVEIQTNPGNDDLNNDDLPNDVKNTSMFKKLVSMYGKGLADKTIKKLFNLK